MITRTVLMSVDRNERLSSRRAAEAPRAGRRPTLRRVLRLVTLASLGLALVTLALALVYSVVTPPSTLMLGRWLTLQPVARETVSLDSVAPALVQAVFASEDQRFCLHHGIDWTAMQQVVGDPEGFRRGASTVTMQTVKNVFLWPGRSFLRKGLEIPLALVVDALWGKRRTMEIYLNVAEWAPGVFGAEAAARHWFRKSARDLTRAEAAMLAAILPNPITRSAAKPSRAVRLQATRIRTRMNGIDALMGCLKG